MYEVTHTSRLPLAVRWRISSRRHKIFLEYPILPFPESAEKRQLPASPRNSRRSEGALMSELCYNRGCGLRFDPHNNREDDCCYHPGVPIFHDALKGCTKGHHSNVKPPEPPKPEITCNKDPADNSKSQFDAEYIIKGPKSAESMKKERPSSDEPMVKLPQKVSKSLQESLEKLNKARQEKSTTPEEVPSSELKAGTSCKHAGCKKTFQGPDSDLETCNFHPGIPIFHEGMKYWSCCKIKTTEFEDFIEQPGCSKGKHLWTKKEADKKLVGCRHDWHQTGSEVVITVYAKTSNPELSYIDANRTMLTIHIMFEQDKVFHKVLNLWGVVDVEKSYVNMGPTKVEINLKKRDPVTWAKLELPPLKVEDKEQKEKNGKEEKDKESKPLIQEHKELYMGDEPPPLEEDESDDSLGLSDTDEEFD
ncbi:cysteine and histidine-rich domain-containing protein 1-like isoform X2 [Hemiscyllium ocellatum]|uniref:cysteine and histidine-rich domain-containing protein 1-like isoform X2 n=1 Tax=Hemiscyllium ocellatum TaxID=170820 RepID=UPI002966CC8C|nr:cysteine and histidine-rich domain-containing protein 1-like isoform X2 [Hemiscyllium ocellatum]